ncbi:DUF2520 domain-containing protein [Pedobacter changchengzhani]|uniref:DUF2520 domain-containing protein n=1 Tax=Pedobacter changchengzhani TaxID=2529274 RepID=A0A4R5MMH2_9SPHI|nr:DUF2520 domain-containing protein [Pedobacter changchengzhani]TDG36868.1 DUF2520 domain-containing protein [Pedobacter changchengzhani]
MKIVLIGSGNVATQMGLALYAIGEEITQVFSRDITNAIILAQKLNAIPISNLQNVNAEADLYIIAVKDDAIENVVLQLKDVTGLVVHTAGSVDIAVISKHIKNSGIFYPLQTFSKTKDVNFENIPLCIEADDENQLSVLKKLAKKLSNKVYVLNGEKRKVLHLAAVFAGNFTNHLYTLANQILSNEGLDFDIIRPLIAETAQKIEHNLPENVQTGPAFRKDDLTLINHLNALENNPELFNIYQILSNSIKLVHKY